MHCVVHAMTGISWNLTHIQNFTYTVIIVCEFYIPVFGTILVSKYQCLYLCELIFLDRTLENV